jgi:hypothetical protein
MTKEEKLNILVKNQKSFFDNLTEAQIMEQGIGLLVTNVERFIFEGLGNSKLFNDFEFEAFETAKDVFKWLNLPDKGINVAAFRPRPVNLDISLDEEASLDKSISSITETYNRLAKAILSNTHDQQVIIGMLIPFFKTGVIQRKGMRLNGRIASFMDWAVIK